VFTVLRCNKFAAEYASAASQYSERASVRERSAFISRCPPALPPREGQSTVAVRTVELAHFQGPLRTVGNGLQAPISQSNGSPPILGKRLPMNVREASSRAAGTNPRIAHPKRQDDETTGAFQFAPRMAS